MSKTEYLERLDTLLGRIPEAQRQEILYDYDEHFRNALADGKTEAEIIEGLGDPAALAKQYIADYSIKQAENSSSFANIVNAILATIGLGFFNLVVVLGPFLGLLGVMFGCFAASIGICIGSIGMMGILLVKFINPAFVQIDCSPWGGFFLFLGLSCFGALWSIGNVYLSRGLYRGTLRYLKWNLDVVMKRSSVG